MTGLLEPHDHGGLRVSMSEVFALGELADAGVLSQQDLAARLGLEKSTVSRLAARLERRGWLSREREPANRRFYRLRLTPQGHAAAERIGEDLRAWHAELFDALSAEERTGLALGLAGLVRAFESRPGKDHALSKRTWPHRSHSPSSFSGVRSVTTKRPRRPGVGVCA